MTALTENITKENGTVEELKNAFMNPDNFTYSKNIDGYRFSDEDFC